MNAQEHRRLFDAIAGEAVAVIGRTGSGKSYTARGFIEIALTEQRRVCIIDPTGIHWGLRSTADGTTGGFPVVVFGGDHADVPIADGSGAAVAELVAVRNLPAIIDISEMSRAGMVRFATAFLETLYRENATPLTLVVDEADIFAPQRPDKDALTLLGRMEQIVRRGRVRGFRPWLITQRPASLNKNVLSQANTLIAMQLTAPQDRDALGDWIEGQADRAQGKKLIADLPKLQKGEGWVWSPSHEILIRVKFPPITTYDSSRTPQEGEPLPQVTLASIDLTGISESLEDFDDDDPKALRERIAELERQLTETGIPVTATDQQLADARADGHATGYREAVEALTPTIECMEANIGHLLDLCKPHRKIDESVDSQEPAADDRKRIHPQVISNAIDALRRRERSPTHSPRRAPKAAKTADSANGALPRAERLILTAAAQLRGKESTRERLSLLSGYSIKSSSFSNAVSALRSRGYVTGYTITKEGVNAAGNVDRLPTGPALVRAWSDRLPKAEAAMLGVLAKSYPRAVSKETLSVETGYSVTSSSFSNALSKLRSLSLAQGRAEIKASDALFG